MLAPGDFATVGRSVNSTLAGRSVLVVAIDGQIAVVRVGGAVRTHAVPLAGLTPLIASVRPLRAPERPRTARRPSESSQRLSAASSGAGRRPNRKEHTP